jgi:hypothetical protein
MYVAEIPGGLRNWGSGSQCRHAVAATIDGPYAPKDLVLGPECHNPSTLRHPKTGLYVCDSYMRARMREVCFARALVLPCACLSTWLLRRWHTQLVSPPLASTRVRVRVCVCVWWRYPCPPSVLGVVPGGYIITLKPKPCFPRYEMFHIGDGPKDSTPPRSGFLHTATLPEGPWTPARTSPPNGCNNPAPAYHPNGTLYVVCNHLDITYAVNDWEGSWSPNRYRTLHVCAFVSRVARGCTSAWLISFQRMYQLNDIIMKFG